MNPALESEELTETNEKTTIFSTPMNTAYGRSKLTEKATTISVSLDQTLERGESIDQHNFLRSNITVSNENLSHIGSLIRSLLSATNLDRRNGRSTPPVLANCPSKVAEWYCSP